MTSTGGDPSVLRRLNAGAVLRALHQARTAPRPDGPVPDDQVGAMTVTELGAAVGVSRPTAEDVVDGLLKQGWVVEVQPDATGRRSAGRPARRFRFSATAGYVVGLDIGWDSVRALVADLSGTIVDHHHASIEFSAPAPNRVEAAKTAVQTTLVAAGVSATQVLAVGIGTTGIVNADGHVVAESVLPGWLDLDLATPFREYLGAPVTVHNDMRLGAVAERWRGAAQGSDDVVYVHAGVRMGAGFLLAGQPHRGAHGASGEVSGPTSVAWRRAQDRLLEHVREAAVPTSAGSHAYIPASVFDDAAGGDRAAHSAVNTYVGQMIKTIEPIIVMMDPEVVVIGGEASRVGDSIAQPVRKSLGKRCLFPPEVLVSPLGSDSVALGAVRVALDQVEAQLFSDGTALTPAPSASGRRTAVAGGR